MSCQSLPTTLLNGSAQPYGPESKALILFPGTMRKCSSTGIGRMQGSSPCPCISSEQGLGLRKLSRLLDADPVFGDGLLEPHADWRRDAELTGQLRLGGSARRWGVATSARVGPYTNHREASEARGATGMLTPRLTDLAAPFPRETTGCLLRLEGCIANTGDAERSFQPRPLHRR
jgi:hypothetical protein